MRSTTRTRTRTRTLSAVAALALAFSLAACGGDETPAADQPDPTTSAESEPAESESADGSTAPEEVAGGYDADELLTAMRAAVVEHESAHLTMEMSGQAGMRGEGDVSYAGDSTTMQMMMTMPQLGQGEMEMRLVDGVMYLSMPPMTPAGKFIEIDTDDPTSPFGDLGGITGGDPRSTFDALDAGLEDVTYLGEEEGLHHYSLTVDGKAAAKAQGQDVGPMPDEVTYDLWVDDADRMRRVEMDLGQATMVMTMDDWGKPVRVEAPPARAVMQLPGTATG
jgi:predicted small lipoprotein YifL